MEMRINFEDGDLNYLANLCHNCGACYDACQFSPPHEFKVNVPHALAVVRNDSYQAYAWPRMLSGLFARNAVAIALTAALSVAGFLVGCIGLRDPSLIWRIHTGPGAFYRLIPHDTLALLFGAIFLYAMIAIGLSVVNFLRDIGEATDVLRRPAGHRSALRDASTLRYLDGGKGGCGTMDGPSSDRRKIYHHLTLYGFLLCFLSTCVATVYHYALAWEAPYAWYDLPVVLGTVGGLGLLLGPAGLCLAKLRRPAELSDGTRTGMDMAFIAMLFMTALTGLALLLMRGTSMMGILLATHLGVVFALFATLPYGKFVHGIYRYVALVRYANDLKTHTPVEEL
jgi:citrate/tricarballylate utilization protein